MGASHRALHGFAMPERRYSMSLSPRQALEALRAADQVDALYAGDLRSAGGTVEGSVSTEGARLELRGQRHRPGALCLPLTTRIRVELVETPEGSSFVLRRMAPRLRAVTEFRRIVVVGLVSVAVIGALSPAVALCILAAHVALVGLVWLVNRSGIAAVNDALIGLVWTVWAPALQSDTPGPYRALAGDQP